MTGLPALECCQKANTKLCSRRLKPLWIFSLLHNVLNSRRPGGSLKLWKTNWDWSWWLITRWQKAVQSLEEETIWSGLASILQSDSKHRALLPYISWHQAVWYPRPDPLLLTNRRRSFLGLAGVFLLDTLSQSQSHPHLVSCLISSLTCC